MIPIRSVKVKKEKQTMENVKIIEKYGITKKTGILILLQMILMIAALIISLFGIFQSMNPVTALNRLVVYGGQALICFATILFGFYYFNKKDVKYFKRLVMGYALLEAVRVSLLQTGGIPETYSVLS